MVVDVMAFAIGAGSGSGVRMRVVGPTREAFVVATAFAIGTVVAAIRYWHGQ